MLAVPLTFSFNSCNPSICPSVHLPLLHTKRTPTVERYFFTCGVFVAMCHACKAQQEALKEEKKQGGVGAFQLCSEDGVTVGCVWPMTR